MRDNTKRGRFSRRDFISRLAQGAGAAGLAAGAFGCDPGSYWDYLTLDDADKVDDRFHESVSGHAKPLLFPTPSSAEYTFLWASDIHITAGEGHHMDKLGWYAGQVGADFILHSGDCADQGTDEDFDKWIKVMSQNLPCPIFTAIGNHDLYNDGWDRFKRYIGPSVWRFIYGSMDVIAIDTANGTLGWDQMQWLEKALGKGDHLPIRLVLSHYPIYDGTAQTPASMGNTEERMKLIHMFDEENVTYFLSGHKHSGERYRIRGVKYIISGAGSSYKEILGDDYHFYRFNVAGASIGSEKIAFDSVGI